ncbi:SIMPL domain-containing protein [Cellvibrio polysaccharolyticus]|uniref:DUF541 domain-containing protein n=1 Tax=Cellvibrio polysaccharolyticus TaxID=2082724 RepID=A0A928V5K9_9GAMM|nr:SIMPL domain-containing protein [Cellvibrio polysaccharolyticus]MBE8717276.1 DUF541 domain-containing protein [Cellvibrio polysaccharolyticus]
MKPVIFFCIAFFASSLAIASPLPDKPHIYIEGSAEIEVIPNQMTISLGLSAENEDVGAAKQDVDKRSTSLLATLKSLAIESRDIATTALQVTPVYDYVEGKQVPRGSRVYRQVEVTLRNLENYGPLMQALVDAELSNTVDTRLAVTDEKAVSDEALVKALEDARARATNLVTSQGKKLGDVYSISEFDLRREETYFLTPNREVYGNAASVSATADRLMKSGEPFEPGVIRAKAKVYVVYLIK